METAIDLIKNVLLCHKTSRFFLCSLRNLFFPPQMNDVIAKTISIEVSSICNAKCIFCPYKFNHRGKKIMLFENFQMAVDACVNLGYENLDLTSLSGELFTHPDALKIISYAKAAGFKHVGTYTNALALWKFNMGNLLTSGIDALLISFPGFQPREFEKIYQVKCCEDFRKSVTLLLEAHRHLHSQVNIIFEPRTYLKKKQIEADDFFHDVISSHIGEHIQLREPLRVFDTWGGMISKNDLLDGMRIDTNPIKSLYPIKKVFLCNRLVILGVLVDGSVRMCNCRYDETIGTENDSLYIDNLYRYSSLTDLIRKNEDKINHLLSDFVKGLLPDLCKNCSFYLPIRTVPHTNPMWLLPIRAGQLNQ